MFSLCHNNSSSTTGSVEDGTTGQKEKVDEMLETLFIWRGQGVLLLFFLDFGVAPF